MEEPGFYAGFFNSGGLADYFADGASPEDGGALLVAYKPDEIADAAWGDTGARASTARDEGRAWGAAAQFSIFASVLE